MNSNTGAIAEFPNDLDALAAGYDIKLSAEDAAYLRTLTHYHRLAWLKRHQDAERAEPHPLSGSRGLRIGTRGANRCRGGNTQANVLRRGGRFKVRK